MNTQVLAPVYDSRNYCDVSCLDSVCVWNEEKDTLTIFAVNKSLEEDLEVSCDLRQFEGYQVKEHIVFTNDDMKAVNTETDPEKVVPVKSAASRMKTAQSAGFRWSRSQKNRQSHGLWSVCMASCVRK